MKHLVILLLIISLLLITACSQASQVTGDVVSDGDSCLKLGSAAKDNCYFEQNKCSKIGKESIRNSCVAGLGIKKQDLEVCKLITSSTTRGYCESGVAAAVNKVEICKDITDNYWRDNCYFNYATENNDALYCSAIGSIEQQQDCFFDVATTINKPELCETLPDNREEICISQIAQQLLDITVCDKIKTALSQDSCRLRLASKVLNNENSCDTIRFKEMRDICHQRFE